VKIGLAQIGGLVGDLEANVDRCLDAVVSAHRAGARLVVLPELAIPGGAPGDILLDSSFIEAVEAATADLAQRSPTDVDVLVGSVVRSKSGASKAHPDLLDAAMLLRDGRARIAAAKRRLQNQDVFFESRWFLPGSPTEPTTIAGLRLGIGVGESFRAGYIEGADLSVTIASSPYRKDILEQRLRLVGGAGVPEVWVNSVGASDELIYDGRSYVTNARGDLVSMLPAFEEEVRVVEVDLSVEPTTSAVALPALAREEELFRALVLGTRQFAEKNRVSQAFIGLSGGVDSALVAVIAAEAFGPRAVTAVAIPSRYTDPRSTECARQLAEALGIGFEVVELEGLHAAAERTLGDLLERGAGAENVQARLRMMILMGFVNGRGGMLLNTSNKTELTLGYSTLYGDTAGSLCPIADLTKPEVVAMARWLAETRGVIPPFILERPPSAELRPDQVDPFDYDKVAPEVDALVRENRSDHAMLRSEHKRWQFGVVLKVSDKAFGSGRLIPITRR